MRSPRRVITPVAAVLCTVAALCPPAHADEPSGGAGYGVTAPDSPETPGGLAPAGPGGLAVSPGAILGGGVSAAGTLAPAAGRSVVIEQTDPEAGWVAVATVTADEAGAFRATWVPRLTGRFFVRARIAPAGDAATTATTAALSGDVAVYRPAKATWYGPGFFGRRTACRKRMTTRLRGVAHKTLPCGTLVDVYYAGRTVQVPVVDRGPFANGAQWDLTQRTARDLGITETVRIGVAHTRAAKPPRG